MNNKTLDTFIELVKIDSTTGNEKEICLFIKNKLEKLGLVVEVDKRNNILVKIDGDYKKQRLLLNAHLDTVEPGRNINVLVENGIIKSDGKTILGADNKTAVAGILVTIEELLLNNKKNNHPLDIVFTTYEESESLGANELDYSKISAKKGYVFDLSNVNLGDIVLASPFYNRLNIKLIGFAAHASNPELGKNVLPVFAKIINRIKFGKVSENTFINFGEIIGGTAVNTVMGEIKIHGEIRSYVESEIIFETEKIEKIIKEESIKNNINYEFEVVRENDGYYFNENDEFLLKTKEKISNFGINSKLIKSGGCSDANIFNNKNLQIINIGDGTVGAHTNNECVSIENLIKLQKLIEFLVI